MVLPSSRPTKLCTNHTRLLTLFLLQRLLKLWLLLTWLQKIFHLTPLYPSELERSCGWLHHFPVPLFTCLPYLSSGSGQVSSSKAFFFPGTVLPTSTRRLLRMLVIKAQMIFIIEALLCSATPAFFFFWGGDLDHEV